MKNGAETSGATNPKRGLQSYFLNNAFVCCKYRCWVWASTRFPMASRLSFSCFSSGCMCAIREALRCDLANMGNSKMRKARVVTPMVMA